MTFVYNWKAGDAQPPLFAKLNSTDWAAVDQVSLVDNQAS